jgi:hypothetical protein
MPITDETRTLIYDKLVKSLDKCSPPMVKRANSKTLSYELTGNKEVPYGYDKKLIPGMFFAAVAQRKDSVTMHFFPCYMNVKMLKLAPTLTKKLKGKTCFHFKKPEDINEKELNAMLKAGIAAWKKMGYMK